MAEKETGTVKWFDARKGYGFISREGGDDVFVHANGMADPLAPVLRDNERVRFEVVPGRKGPAAENVERVE